MRHQHTTRANKQSKSQRFWSNEVGFILGIIIGKQKRVTVLSAAFVTEMLDLAFRSGHIDKLQHDYLKQRMGLDS